MTTETMIVTSEGVVTHASRGFAAILAPSAPPPDLLGRHLTDDMGEEASAIRRLCDRALGETREGAVEVTLDRSPDRAVARRFTASRLVSADDRISVVVQAEEMRSRAFPYELQALRPLLDALPVAVLLIDPSGTIVLRNAAHKALFGERHDIAGVDDFDRIEGWRVESGQRVSSTEWPLTRAFRELAVVEPHEFLVPHGTQGGSLRLSVSARPLIDRNGQLIGGIAVSEDITDVVALRQSVRDGERRLQLLIDNATDHAIFMLDSDGHVATWGEGPRSIKQYEDHEILGCRWDVFFPPDQRDEGIPDRLLALARDEGCARWLGWRVRRDGTRFWADTVLSAVRDGDAIVGFTELARDLTERLQSEEQIHLRDRVIEAVAQGILVTSKDHEIVFASSGFEALTGYTPAEAVGRRPSFLSGSGTAANAMEPLYRSVAQGASSSQEMVSYRKDGSSFWNAVFATPIVGRGGEIEQHVLIMADVTERHDLEDKLRQSLKMDALGRLAGSVSHDFNNLLTVINGNAEDLLSLPGFEEDVYAQLRLMHNAGQRASAVTRQLLTFSRRQNVELSVIRLDQLLKGMEDILASLTGGRTRLVFDIHAPQRIWPICADQSQIEQIILNLAINARDAMTDHGILRISLRNLSGRRDEGDQVQLVFRDNGCGMSDEVRARALEPFFSTKGENGSGLGLATVFGIVRQSGGQIDIASSVGAGTTVAIGFPRCVTTEEVVERPEPIGVVAPQHKLAILLIEDHHDVRAFVSRALRKRGHDVVEAEGVAAARVALSQSGGRFDLVVSDIVLADGNGIRAFREFARDYPDLRVLYISGFVSDPDDLVDVSRSGGHYLQKPFSTAELLHAVHQAFSHPGTVVTAG